MKVISKYLLPLLLILLLAVPIARGEDQAPKAEAGQQAESSQTEQPQSSVPDSGGWLSNGKALGPWWMMRATKHDPMPAEILYHVEASYNLAKMTGNFENETHGASGRLVLRKNRVTPSLAYTLDKADMTLLDMRIKYKMQRAVADLNVDLPMRFLVSGGFMWNQDERVFVDSQGMYYIGCGNNILDSPKYQFKVNGGYTRSKLESMFDAGTDETNRFYLMENAFVVLTSSISLMQSLWYHQALDSSDDYYWEFLVSLDCKITEHLSLKPFYRVQYDDLYRPEMIRNMPREKQDVTVMISIQVSL